MTVHLYALCWNEADILPFFFRHYDPWVDRYVMFDNGSTDRTHAILAAHPKVEIRRFPFSHPNSFVLSEQDLSDQVWKESRGRADWVVVTDVDEHLHVAGGDTAAYLRDCTRRGVTIIPAIGFQMVSDEFPAATERLAQHRTRGAPFTDMNKLSLFNPDAVAEIRFGVGRHRARPEGELRRPRVDRMMLLHYKYLDFERTQARQQALGAALKQGDVARNFGYQYRWSEAEFRADWDALKRRSLDVAVPGFRPEAAVARNELWWLSQDPPLRFVRPTRAEQLALAWLTLTGARRPR